MPLHGRTQPHANVSGDRHLRGRPIIYNVLGATAAVEFPA